MVELEAQERTDHEFQVQHTRVSDEDRNENNRDTCYRLAFQRVRREFADCPDAIRADRSRLVATSHAEQSKCDWRLVGDHAINQWGYAVYTDDYRWRI